jgi:hypothetical protein
MIESIKKAFSKPTAANLAEEELENAKRELLRHTTAMEYSKHMTNYYSGVIERLKRTINKENSNV